MALVLAGCQPASEPAPAVTAVPSAPVSTAASSPAADASAAPEDWAGTYRFGEAIPGQGWDYILVLQPDPVGALVGTVDADGFQTHTRFDVRGEMSGERLAVVLTGYRPENRFAQPAVGTRLFTLDRSGGGEVVTRWEGLTPQLPETPREGVAFVRSE